MVDLRSLWAPPNVGLIFSDKPPILARNQQPLGASFDRANLILETMSAYFTALYYMVYGILLMIMSRAVNRTRWVTLTDLGPHGHFQVTFPPISSKGSS